MVPSAPADPSAPTGLTPARLLTLCPALASASALCVAYSGGLDSTVLLHLLVQLHKQGLLMAPLRAVHVHHGLQAAADDWMRHCELQCATWQVAFAACHVDVILRAGDSPEAAARDARYAAFAATLQSGEFLVQAHHANDQAETLLLRLLRGSGLSGLGGMPEQRSLAQGSLLRPLLGVDRHDLHGYAQANGLEWIEDPSNAEIRFDRNFVRSQVLPVLQQRWPSAIDSLQRSASLFGEVGELLDQLAAEDLRRVQDEKFTNRLSTVLLQPMGAARQRNLLRYWLTTQAPELQGSAPGYHLLQRCARELLQRSVLEPRQLEWGKAPHALQLHRYRDVLYLLRPLPAPPAAKSWTLTQPLVLPSPLGTLHWQTPELITGVPQQLELRFRNGSELIAKGDGQHQSLKNYWQERGIPPWLRNCVPLLYHGEELVAIGEEVIATSSLGIATQNMQPLHWQRSLLLCGW